jgi:RHS repeat-associated protein
VTNSSGAPTGTGFGINTYDEYGVPGSSNVGLFQYTGQPWLSEAGAYHYRARAYLPALGRFAQTDPIGMQGGINLYAYVLNDPVNLSDPSGLLADCRYQQVRVAFARETSDGQFEGGYRWEWQIACTEESSFSFEQRLFNFESSVGTNELLHLETPGPLVPRELSRCERAAVKTANPSVSNQTLNSARLWVGRVPTWLRSGSSGITLGHNVFLRSYSPRSAIDVGLITHEVTGHIPQEDSLGILFGPAYAGAATWSFLTSGNTDTNNPFEQEAYALGGAGAANLNASGFAGCTDTPGSGG